MMIIYFISEILGMLHSSDNSSDLSSYSYNNSSRYSVDYFDYMHNNLSSLECGSVPDIQRIKVRKYEYGNWKGKKITYFSAIGFNYDSGMF